MGSMDVKTTDLFMVAYFLNNRIKPLKVITEGRNLANKKKIVFIFPRSTDVLKHVEKFKLGQAITNVIEFKNNFHIARDLMFDELRNQ